MGRRGPQPDPDEAKRRRGSKRRGNAERITSKPRDSHSYDKARVPSCKQITTICREGIPHYDAWKDASGFSFDAVKAQDAIRFFHHEIKHAKGPLARRPFKLEPWEIAIIGNLYGWRVEGHPELRRYTECLVYVARKNGKTPLAAGIITYELFEGGDQGAEIYGAASEYKQASLVFEHVRGFVTQNPRLRDSSQIYRAQSKSVQLGEDKLWSTYRVIASDADTAQGFNANCIVIDELHTQPDRKLYDALKTALSGRDNPLLISITTADYERPGSICNEMYDHAKQVREGSLPDPRFLPVIYECNRDADWTRPDTWTDANPNLSISKRIDYMEEQCRRAQRNPAHLNSFLRFDLNMKTTSHTRWLTKEAWDACGTSYDAAVFEGVECTAGLDLASTRDLTAFVMIFAEEDGKYALLPWFWCPEGQIRREWEDGRDYYKRWADDGLLRVTPGNMTDYDRVRKDINELAATYPIQRIAVDRMFQGAQLGAQLDSDGFEVVAFGQGYLSMTAPTKAFDGLVYDSKLRHPGNPIMDWMAANVCIETDAADNWKPSKKVSTGKIDGIVAAIMALGLALAKAPSAAPSIDWV